MACARWCRLGRLAQEGFCGLGKGLGGDTPKYGQGLQMSHSPFILFLIYIFLTLVQGYVY